MQDWVESFTYRGEVDRNHQDALAENYILTTCSCKVHVYAMGIALACDEHICGGGGG